MNPQQKIDELKKKILEEQQKIDRCSHQWSDPYSDPGTRSVPTGITVQGQGSDVWPVASGWVNESYPRWARQCKKCGKVEYTEKSEPVITYNKPVF